MLETNTKQNIVSIVASMVLVFVMLFSIESETIYAGTGDESSASGTTTKGSSYGVAMTIETPELLVTGQSVLGGTSYTAENISNERAYTRDELKAMPPADQANNKVYSCHKAQEPFTKFFKTASGVYVDSILKGTAFNAVADKLTFKAQANEYTVQFIPGGEYVNGGKFIGNVRATTGFAEQRYHFPGLRSGSAIGKYPIKPVIAWAYTDGVNDSKPADAGEDEYTLTLLTGQLGVTDQNTPFNVTAMEKIIGGDEITTDVLDICGKLYTRAKLLLMDRATYTYGEDKVRGVPMSVLLEDYSDNSVFYFSAVNGIAPAANGMTKKQLVDGNYMLAYEKESAGQMKGIYDTDNGEHGFLTLYGDGATPAKMITGISQFISKQPVSRSYVLGASPLPLTVDSVKSDAQYQWYRSASPDTSSGTAITGQTGKTYIPDISAVGRHYYYVKVRTSDDSVQETSKVVAITVNPKVPAKIKATSASYKSIKLGWSRVNGASGYYIYRYSQAAKAYKYIKNVSGSASSCTDTGLTTGKKYSYKVRAFQTVGGSKFFSSYTAVGSAVPTLSKPTLRLYRSGSRSIKLKWTNISGETGYQVYRSTSKNGKYSKIKTLSYKYSSWVNSRLKKGKYYYYKVRAYKKTAAGNSYSPFSAVKYMKR